MKNATKLLLMLLMAFTVILSSCDEEGIDPMLIDEENALLNEIDSTVFGAANMENWVLVAETQVPESVINYVLEHYGDDIIEHLWVDENGGFVVLLVRGIAIRFNNDGIFIKVILKAKRKRNHGADEGDFDISDLPQAALDYMASHFPELEIERIEVDGEGNFYVKIEGFIVIFDADGNFKEVRSRQRKEEERRNHWTGIDISRLPDVIVEYISLNYAEATIIRAGVNSAGKFGV
ncbi:MAG TPA: PepSY-like domain-containing protein, partial [Roseivirga sp.]